MCHCSFNRSVQWGKSPSCWRESAHGYANGYRYDGIEERYDRPKPRRHHSSLRHERNANRVGGSFQRKLFFIARCTHIRIGYYCDPSRVTCSGF
jgi:hypothetical protein